MNESNLPDHISQALTECRRAAKVLDEALEYYERTIAEFRAAVEKNEER